jgi:hypothetical protein
MTNSAWPTLAQALWRRHESHCVNGLQAWRYGDGVAPALGRLRGPSRRNRHSARAARAAGLAHRDRHGDAGHRQRVLQALHAAPVLVHSVLHCLA